MRCRTRSVESTSSRSCPPSTEAYDRGEKGKRYRNIHSQQHYVLVEQQTPHVEVYTRQGDFWTYREASGLDASIHLDAIDCSLALGDVSAKVRFTTQEPG